MHLLAHVGREHVNRTVGQLRVVVVVVVVVVVLLL